METQTSSNTNKKLSISQKEELKSRVEAMKKLLEAKKSEFKADAMNHLRDEKKRIDDELNHIQSLVADGWEKATEKTAEKINQWLKNVNTNDGNNSKT